jgi:hypothetical protein
VFVHCNSTLAFASSKVERFDLSVRDKALRSSEQAADRSKRTKPVAQRRLVAFFCN